MSFEQEEKKSERANSQEGKKEKEFSLSEIDELLKQNESIFDGLNKFSKVEIFEICASVFFFKASTSTPDFCMMVKTTEPSWSSNANSRCKASICCCPRSCAMDWADKMASCALLVKFAPLPFILFMLYQK